MSSTDPREPAAHAPRTPLDDDDHDLLTFTEAGERLRLEIAAADEHLQTLEVGGDEQAMDRARARLQALRAAADRNRAAPINDANFEKFFGYPGTARRTGSDLGSL